MSTIRTNIKRAEKKLNKKVLFGGNATGSIGEERRCPIATLTRKAASDQKMILDILENAKLYNPLHDGFLKAFTFLKRPDLAGLGPGRHEIAGERVFALVSKGSGRQKSEGKLETHRKYIDIQYVIAGSDEMGWKPGSACTVPAGPYDPDKDIQFFTDEPDSWVLVHPGAFAIFFPEDAHLPLISGGVIHKIVVKVAV